MSSTPESVPQPLDPRGRMMTRLFADLQIARFSELFYQTRGGRMRTLANTSNIVSALSATAVVANMLSSAAAGTPQAAVWIGMTILAAAGAAASPILGWDAKAAQMEKAALGHCIVRERIKRLLSDLKNGDLDPEHIGRDQEIDAFRLAFAALDEPGSPKTLERCWAQALKEYPSDQAWSIV